MSTTSRQQPIRNVVEPDERRWNSTCRAIGHDRQSTTSDTFRRCIRAGCQAVQQRRGEWWVYAPLKSPPAKRRSKQADAEQPPLLS
jgi:hypothetical protein